MRTNAKIYSNITKLFLIGFLSDFLDLFLNCLVSKHCYIDTTCLLCALLPLNSIKIITIIIVRLSFFTFMLLYATDNKHFVQVYYENLYCANNTTQLSPMNEWFTLE